MVRFWFYFKVEPTGFPDNWCMEEKEESKDDSTVFGLGNGKDGAVISCGWNRIQCCHIV